MQTKIILELCCNHQGSVEIAKEMIDEADRLNVWGVKLQKRDIDSMGENDKNEPRNSGNSFGPTYYEHRKALEFSIDEVKEIKNYIESKGLKAIVSIFDEVSAKQMIGMGFEYIKLPSQLYSNEKLVSLIGESKSKLIGSTGMHTLEEVESFKLNYVYDVLMFCRSVYPCQLSEIKLGNLTDFKDIVKHKNFPFPALGYSSHDIEGIGIKYAVVLGVEYIERHYTLNKSWKGSDHKTVSSDFEEMESIIKEIDFVETYINAKSTDLDEKEKEVRKKYRGF